MALSSVLLLYLINDGRMKFKSLWVPSTCFCELTYVVSQCRKAEHEHVFKTEHMLECFPFLGLGYLLITTLSFFFFPSLNVVIYWIITRTDIFLSKWVLFKTRCREVKKKKKASWDPHKPRTPNMLALVFSLVHMVG